jgi:ABC-2 type transport system permease protein
MTSIPTQEVLQPSPPGAPVATRGFGLLRRELGATYAFMERNLFLVKRYWGWEIAWLVYATAGALSIAFIGADQGDPALLLSLMIGATFWNYLSIVFGFIAETVAWERWEGTLEYTFMAPIRRWTQLLGSTLFAVIYGLVHTTVILLVLTAFFGLDLTQADFVTAGVFMLIGSASFIGIGMMAAVLPLMYVERGAQMTFVIQSLLLLVSGVYYSISVLPEWMQVLSAFSPATYVLDGVRQGLVYGTPVTELLHDVWPLIVMAIVLIPLGVWVFGRAERYAKRTGRLKRVG